MEGCFWEDSSHFTIFSIYYIPVLIIFLLFWAMPGFLFLTLLGVFHGGLLTHNAVQGSPFEWYNPISTSSLYWGMSSKRGDY